MAKKVFLVKFFWHRWDSNPQPVFWGSFLQYFWDLDANWPRLHLEEFLLKIALFLLPKQVGGLGPGVSALPMGPMDVLENYIFEISVKNWKNEPEENFLEGFFHLIVSKKRGGGPTGLLEVKASACWSLMQGVRSVLRRACFYFKFELSC